jgi:hypothetical protein
MVVAALIKIFGENQFQVMPVKALYVGIVRYIIVIIPVGELVVQGIVEANKDKYADCG